MSTFSRGAVAELKMPLRSQGYLLQHRLNPPTTNPTQPLVTQMQPPMLPPPPHPNFQSVDLHTQPPLTSDPLLISNSEAPVIHSQTAVVTRGVLGTALQDLLAESQSHLTLTSSRTQHQVSDGLLIESDSKGSNISAGSQTSPIIEPYTEPSNPPVGRPFGFRKLDLYYPTPTQSPATQTNTSHPSSISQSFDFQAELNQTQTHRLVTKSTIYQSGQESTSTQISQTKFKHQGQRLHQETHLQSSPTFPDPQETFTQSLLPKFHLELSTNPQYQPSTQPPPSSVTKPQQSRIPSEPMKTMSTLPQSPPTQHPLLHSQTHLPQTETFPLQHRNTLKIQPSISTALQTSDPSTLDPVVPVVHQVNMSDKVQRNTSQKGDPAQGAKSTNDTELTEWLKRNTSQSPMTSNDQR